MGKPKQLFKAVWAQFAAPKVSEAELERSLQEVWHTLPVPVFWLLGKTQSGKTSLIRAVTQNSRVEIGDGIRACTATAREYPFPSEADCILRFLDTRGLGEVNYDPTPDIALFQDQAHLLVVVMKAMDHAQQAVMAALKQIHAARPQWPILVVQTTLHEGYPSREQQHILPYPFGTTSFSTAPFSTAPFSTTTLSPQVPSDLTRSLLTQRRLFADAGIPARFVPVDFTLPGDGYEPADYGLEALWEAVEELLPLGLRGMMQQYASVQKTLRDVHLRAAHPHVTAYAVAAGAAATVPVPMVDIPLVLAIQAKMFHAIASIYHQDFDRKQIGELLSGLGVGFLGRLGGRELLKVIPGYGSAISALYAGASTYALGLTLCFYYGKTRDGGVPDPTEFRRIYDDHFQEGRRRLRSYLDGLGGKPSEPANP